MLFRSLSIWTLCLLPTPQQEPDTQAQKQAETTLRETFKAEYAKKQPGDQRSLALKLIEYSSSVNPQDTALRYVALREARDLYIRLGDLDSAFKTVDKMAKAFQIEAIPAKIAVLSKLAQGNDVYLTANFYLMLAGEAVVVDRHEEALKCLALSESGAKAVKDASFSAAILSMRREVDTLKVQYQKAKAPDAPVSEMGKYLCLYKGDWGRGLPMLSEAKEESLRSVSMAELAKPFSTEDQLQVADAWWDWSMKEKNAIAKEKGQAHACSLYEKLAGLNVTTKSRIDERLRAAELLRLGDRLELVPGVPQRTRGIKVWYEIGDGRAVDGFYFGRPCARTGFPETGPCIYFEVPKAWAGKDSFLEISVECYDVTAAVYVNYNEHDAAGKDTARTAGAIITLGNTSVWRTIQFKMPAAGCNNGMHGADFRIVATGEFYLHRLVIRKVAK
jgi:hypothetical protein